MTVRQLITSSLRLIGVLASGETLPAADGADALSVLNDLLDAWRAERLTLFEQQRTENTLVGGTQRYTIGTGGAWNQQRPLWIDAAGALFPDGLEIPIKLYSRDEWAEQALKDLDSNIPEGIFYNPAFPLGEIDVWPVPDDATMKVVLYAPKSGLTSVASLDTVISMPPGWAKALRYNLALDLAPEYGRQADPAVVATAIDAKATIKRANILPEDLAIDPALSAGGGAWDWRTGDYR